MKRQFLVTLALLFIALGVPSHAQDADVTVEEGAPLSVECALRVEERAEWRLDGGALPADLRPAGEAAAAGRLTARLAAAAARPQHSGEYTCSRAPGQRVRVLVRAAALHAARALPDAAGAEGAGAAAERAGAGAGEADAPLIVMYYDVGRFFSFNCTVPRAPGQTNFVWTKNGTTVSEVWDLRNRYELLEDNAVFKMKTRTNEDDFGNYTCTLGDNSLSWQLRGRPHAKLPSDTNVVEGQKLKLTCKVVGKPYPAVAWSVAAGDNSSSVTEALGARVRLARSEQGVEGAELLLEPAERRDAGVYTCAPAGGVAADTTLRVKDMYAALWPFLGICAEVFVLCAIILLYEKRRTKPELDDSDTDNHEQKKS